MAEETSGIMTGVTRVTKEKETGEHPMMSYTAVTTHRSMAQAFVGELLRVARRIMPDHELSIEDLVSVCHVALDTREHGVVMLEGKHLRGRVAEQISRADRYQETFSVQVIGWDKESGKVDYDSVVDTLCERLRKTDLMFLFKSRLVLLLPHTGAEASARLADRIRRLIEVAFANPNDIVIDRLTYPSPEIARASEVLDWVEDKIRS
ncbi:MAG: hypothetical protein PHU25_00215 [Deltaproteobacteria bacterium]|nr:hypothetical protein [Deltaproteobacteria bacterium]